MEESQYLYETLFLNQAPAAGDYFQSRAASCFTSEEGCVQVYVCGGCRCPDAKGQPRHGDGAVSRSEPESAVPERRPPKDIKSPMPLEVLDIHSADELAKFTDRSQHEFIIFFIEQRNSRSRLTVSLGCFTALLDAYQIPKQLLNFVCCFRLRSGETGLSPPPMLFRWHPAEENKHFECTYILRFVELNHRGEKNPWSLRQFLLFQRFSPSTIWIFVALSKSMRRELQSYLSSSAGLPLNPFAIHLILIHAAAATWRGYLDYIAEEVRNLTERAVLADFDREGIYLAELGERQYLKQLEDMLTDITSAVDSSLDVCFILGSRYSEFEGTGTHSMRSSPGVASKIFPQMLAEKERELRHHRSEADRMLMKVRSAETLVTNILDLDNGNALKVLGVEARAENASMQALTAKAARDTAAVKVITVVTLVYLPITVVLNFFSTSFVNYSSCDTGTANLTIAHDWWISVVVAGPLTAMTLYVWWFYVQTFVNAQPPTWLKTLHKCYQHLPSTRIWKRRHSNWADSETHPSGLPHTLPSSEPTP